MTKTTIDTHERLKTAFIHYKAKGFNNPESYKKAKMEVEGVAVSSASATVMVSGLKWGDAFAEEIAKEKELLKIALKHQEADLKLKLADKNEKLANTSLRLNDFSKDLVKLVKNPLLVNQATTMGVLKLLFEELEVGVVDGKEQVVNAKFDKFNLKEYGSIATTFINNVALSKDLFKFASERQSGKNSGVNNAVQVNINNLNNQANK